MRSCRGSGEGRSWRKVPKSAYRRNWPELPGLIAEPRVAPIPAVITAPCRRVFHRPPQRATVTTRRRWQPPPRWQQDAAPHNKAPAKVIRSRKLRHNGTWSAGAHEARACCEHRRSACPPSVAALRAVDFLEDLRGDTERFQAGGYAAIGADLQQDLLDLVARHAVAQRSAQMQAEFGAPVEGGQHRQVYHAAGLSRQAWTRPDHAPCDFSCHLLERRVEIVRASERTIDVLSAQNVAPDIQAFLEQVALIFGTISECSPSRNSSAASSER